MDLNTVATIGVTVVLAFCMYQMRKQDEAINDVRNTLNAVIAGMPNTYARRDDIGEMRNSFRDLSEAIFARLTRIEDKIDKKADK